MAGQLGLKEEFPIAKNILAKNFKIIVTFYTFIEDSFLTDTSYVALMIIQQAKLSVQKGNNPETTEKYGKSYHSGSIMITKKVISQMKILFIIIWPGAIQQLYLKRNMFSRITGKGRLIWQLLLIGKQLISELESWDKIVIHPYLRKFDIPAILKLRRLIKTENYEKSYHIQQSR